MYRKKRYEGVGFNVIRIRRGWVWVSNIRYVKLERPPYCMFFFNMWFQWFLICWKKLRSYKINSDTNEWCFVSLLSALKCITIKSIIWRHAAVLTCSIHRTKTHIFYLQTVYFLHFICDKLDSFLFWAVFLADALPNRNMIWMLIMLTWLKPCDVQSAVTGQCSSSLDNHWWKFFGDSFLFEVI